MTSQSHRYIKNNKKNMQPSDSHAPLNHNLESNYVNSLSSYTSKPLLSSYTDCNEKKRRCFSILMIMLIMFYVKRQFESEITPFAVYDAEVASISSSTSRMN